MNSLLIRTLVFLCLVSGPLFAKQIETFYGPVEIDEPILLELIDSPPFQRLKHIHQYGIAFYTTHREEYNRYEHSLGVFYLLRANGCSLKEQISGLLHDVSHTIFSHVGDWIFNRQNQELDYQTLTLSDYLELSGLRTILNSYGYTSDEILPKQELFPALEQPLPDLCADRIDYNIQGAFYQGFITYDEAIQISQEIHYIDGEWIIDNHELLKKLVRFSLFMTEDCWGSGTEYVLSMWLAEAILRGIDIGLLTIADIRFGVDQDIWDLLHSSCDGIIQQNMHKILHHSDFHSFVAKEEADIVVVSKFRGIDPNVIVDGIKVRLTMTDPTLAEEYQKSKERMASGFGIKLQTAVVEYRS